MLLPGSLYRVKLQLRGPPEPRYLQEHQPIPAPSASIPSLPGMGLLFQKKKKKMGEEEAGVALVFLAVNQNSASPA